MLEDILTQGLIDGGYYDASRPPITIDAGHPLRRKSALRSGVIFPIVFYFLLSVYAHAIGGNVHIDQGILSESGSKHLDKAFALDIDPGPGRLTLEFVKVPAGGQHWRGE